MTTDRSVTLTLDSADGVRQFLVYVEEVMYAAYSYEVDARELAASDPTHVSEVDGIADTFQTLYGTMRTEIAAAATRGGMTAAEAEKLQLAYNELTTLRDQLEAASLSVPKRNTSTEQGLAAVVASHSQTVVSEQSQKKPAPPKRKTLTVAADAVDAAVPISYKKVRSNQSARPTQTSSPRPVSPATQPAQVKQPAIRTNTRTNTPSAHLPSPGIHKPDATKALLNAPLLGLVSDPIIRARIIAYPEPKQLEQRLKAILDREEAKQTDRFSSWLGDAQTHTFSYLQDKDVSTVYGLAALPITELRAALSPHRVRPEAFIHWVQYLRDLQSVFPGTPTSRVGEVMVSALVMQLLGYEA